MENKRFNELLFSSVDEEIFNSDELDWIFSLSELEDSEYFDLMKLVAPYLFSKIRFIDYEKSVVDVTNEDQCVFLFVSRVREALLYAVLEDCVGSFERESDSSLLSEVAVIDSFREFVGKEIREVLHEGLVLCELSSFLTRDIAEIDFDILMSLIIPNS